MQIDIGIKYCGGCNPVIDRTKLAKEIEKFLSPEYSLSKDPFSNSLDVGILICGCLTACADKPDYKNLARKWIIVACNSINHNLVPEEELADLILQKIKD